MSPADDKKKWIRSIIEIAPVLALLISAITLYQLMLANNIQREYLAATLRPYAQVQGIDREYINVGKGDEQWRLLAAIVNQGQVPAMRVRGAIFWDTSKQPQLPASEVLSDPLVLGPGGGSVGINRVISKREATAILDRGPLFVHAVVLYQDGRGREYKHWYTAQCGYKEGDFLVFSPVTATEEVAK